VLWPFNAHFHVPLLEVARGGSLLTGIGGDEVFGTSRWARAASVLGLRQSPEPRDAPRIALFASPHVVRRHFLARRFPADFPWLTRDARVELARRWGADAASEPARLGPRIEWLYRRRWLEAGVRSLGLLARDANAAIAHPLLSSGFGGALAAACRRRRFDDRTATMRALFGEVLPPELLTRPTKACFDAAFWGAHSRRQATVWRGEAVDPDVVDADALEAEWTMHEPDAHTYLLMQSIWLESSKNGHLDHRRVAGPVEAA
jgi:asparagine synthase (glutamine-hydrolysing)